MLRGFTKTIGHLVFLLEFSIAFQPKHTTHTPSKAGPSSTATTGDKGFDFHDALKILPEPAARSSTPAGDVLNVHDVDVNLDKARDFASHFGKYSYTEVEHMRDDLHAHRILNDSPNDILFLERILEDELSSQLLSLKEQMPEPYLFRYPDNYNNYEMPASGLFGSGTEDNIAAAKDKNKNNLTEEPFHQVSFTAKEFLTSGTSSTAQSPSTLAETKQLLGEGGFESLVICFALVVIMMAPNHFL